MNVNARIRNVKDRGYGAYESPMQVSVRRPRRAQSATHFHTAWLNNSHHAELIARTSSGTNSFFLVLQL
jgi:hypothetical protein